MQVHESIQEVGDAGTDVEKVYDPVVKVKVQAVGHRVGKFL